MGPVLSYVSHTLVLTYPLAVERHSLVRIPLDPEAGQFMHHHDAYRFVMRLAMVTVLHQVLDHVAALCMCLKRSTAARVQCKGLRMSIFCAVPWGSVSVLPLVRWPVYARSRNPPPVA